MGVAKCMMGVYNLLYGGCFIQYLVSCFCLRFSHKYLWGMFLGPLLYMTLKQVGMTTKNHTKFNKSPPPLEKLSALLLPK
jgi:hypothetical protein